MGCGCGSKNKTATTAAPAAQLFEVINNGGRIVFRTRVESVAQTKAAAIPGGTYRPAGTK